MLMLDEMRYGYQIKLVIYSSVKFGCHGDTGGGERRLTRKKCHFSCVSHMDASQSWKGMRGGIRRADESYPEQYGSGGIIYRNLRGDCMRNERDGRC